MFNRVAIHVSSFVSIAFFAVTGLAALFIFISLFFPESTYDPMENQISTKETLLLLALSSASSFVFFMCAKQKLLAHVIVIFIAALLASFSLWSWVTLLLTLVITLPVWLASPKFLK